MIYSTNLPDVPRVKAPIKLREGNYIAIMKDGLGITYPLNARIVKIENNKLFLEIPMFIPVDEMK